MVFSQGSIKAQLGWGRQNERRRIKGGRIWLEAYFSAPLTLLERSIGTLKGRKLECTVMGLCYTFLLLDCTSRGEEHFPSYPFARTWFFPYSSIARGKALEGRLHASIETIGFMYIKGCLALD